MADGLRPCRAIQPKEPTDMTKTFALLALLAATSLAAIGCSNPPAGGDTGKKAAAAQGGGAENAEAKEIFNTRCVACHGSSGKGDGPGAVALNPKPRNYTDAAWQKSVTDEQLSKTIIEGGAAVGKSPTMPPNPDLVGKKATVDGLVKIIRGFAK
jgi:mono/diheme cytochrome c family protein